VQTESFNVATPIGILRISCSEKAITDINLSLDIKKSLPTNVNISNKSMSSFCLNAKRQIDEYFSNALYSFDLKLNCHGTAFQRSVWNVISSIKVGETLTYSDIADKLKSSPRAIGNACRSNPIPIIVPCHRVVSKSGVGGFAGQVKGKNIDVKQWLLKHEQAAIHSTISKVAQL